jgi:tetratricopeptide (TPR) repeat protein
LFSSYGLTQKATHLLENVLQRAPRHTPTLERLLDLHLGAGNDRRTAELAAQLEQIHRERNDHVNADRFSELRQRFSKVAGLTAADMPAAPAIAAPAPAATEVPAAVVALTAAPETVAPQAQASVAAPAEPPPFEIAPTPPPVVKTPAAASAPIEFEIPLTELGAETAADDAAVAPIPVEEPTVPAMPEAVSEAGHAVEPVEAVPAAASEELDLSDEWEAISAEVQEAQAPATDEPARAQVELDPVLAPEPASSEPEVIEAAAQDVVSHADAEPDYNAKAPHFEIDANTAQADLTADVAPAEAPSESEPESVIEIVEEAAEQTAQPVESANTEALPDSLLEFLNEPAPEEVVEAAAPSGHEIELELTPEPASKPDSAEPATTDDFISELVAELDDLEAPVPAAQTFAEPAVASSPDQTQVHLQEVFAQTNLPPMEPIVPAAHAGGSNGTANGTGGSSAETLNELAEVFQEFRTELGEMGEEDEDLETHYNLGIAYREMGLLDEAIGEFQKVAKAVQKGKPFQYEMNCSTMLGLSFMDKGEPKVASLWYQRALQVPGLEQESILALRYDLAMALESAGESDAALDSFRQVYAANIDYRDVADRIATLQRH